MLIIAARPALHTLFKLHHRSHQVIRMASNVQDLYDTTIDLAKKAGKMALEAFHRDKKVDTKDSSCDLVTETDQQVENYIISTLKGKYPSHRFIGEESVSDGMKCQLTDEPTWIIDPIDGTTNFVHRFPFVAVSIAHYINKQPIVGVVYNLVLDQMFAAKKNGGATMNGKPISVSQCKDLKSSVVLVEFGSDRRPEMLKKKVDTMYNLAANHVHALRSAGSAALDVCYVASGSSEAYVEYGIHCWDVAAGALILQEAGGVMLSPKGETFDVMKRGVLAANSTELAMQIVPHVNHINLPSD